MNRYFKNFLSLSLLLFLLIQCDRKNEDFHLSGTLVFSINNLPGNEGGRVSAFSDASQIILTIQKRNGDPTEYTTRSINLFHLDSSVVSEKLLLETGEYVLTEFFLIDDAANILYIAPIEGSVQSQNVSQPLPIDFVIATNIEQDVVVEVLSAEGLNPVDFGLVSFSLSEVELLSFLVGVVDKNGAKSVDIEVTSGEFSYSQKLVDVLDNIVSVNASYPSYTINITEIGYVPFEYTYTKDSLAQHLSIPLVIGLDSMNLACPNLGTFVGDATLLTQQDIEDFGNGCYSAITGKLQIGEFFPDNPFSIIDLTPLNTLTAVGDEMVFYSNDSLTTFQGLENVKSVGGYISIYSNPVLESIEALSGMTYVGSSISIDDNSALASISGLAGLNELKGNFVVRNNDALLDLVGLNNVKSSICVFIQGNNKLSSLDGIDSLSTATCLYIDSNLVLNDFCAIVNLFQFDSEIIYDINTNLFNPTRAELESGVCTN